MYITIQVRFFDETNVRAVKTLYTLFSTDIIYAAKIKKPTRARVLCTYFLKSNTSHSIKDMVK